MAFRALLALLLLATSAVGIEISRAHDHSSASLRVRGAVPSDGKCINEGDYKTGNHCVKLGGPAGSKGRAELDKFQQSTNQDFGHPSEWCICLHLYESAGGESQFPSADLSQCSPGARSATS